MSFMRDLVPPLASKLLKRIRANVRIGPARLFDGDDEMFKRVASSALVYGEYGVGASTDWVYNNTGARILAVDTSKAWASSILRNKDANRISVKVGDYGEVGEWGRPQSYEFRKNFADYLEYIWKQDAKPDTVLIDGRFRVACFLTSLLRARQGDKILFDDYVARPRYHVVEEVLEPIETCGRQALFEVPAKFDTAFAERLLEEFRMVMD